MTNSPKLTAADDYQAAMYVHSASIVEADETRARRARAGTAVHELVEAQTERLTPDALLSFLDQRLSDGRSAALLAEVTKDVETSAMDTERRSPVLLQLNMPGYVADLPYFPELSKHFA